MKNIKRSVSALLIAASAALLPTAAFADGIPCRPIDIFENANGVFVHCADVQNGISYISVPLNTQNRADRFIEMATAAMLSGLVFFAWTDDNSAHNPLGCDANGCRGATQWGLSKSPN